MPNDLILPVEKRILLGSKIKKLRSQGLLPANLFGKNIKSQALSVVAKDFYQMYKAAGETGVIRLQIKDDKLDHPTLIGNIQTDPITKKVLHIDFRQVDLKEKLKAMVPVKLVGEAPVVMQGALIYALKDEVEIEALPTDIPEHLEIDITKLVNIGDSLTAAEIQVDFKKVTLLTPKTEVMVKAEAPKEEVEEAKPEAEAEPETPAEEKVEETKADQSAGKAGETKTKPARPACLSGRQAGRPQETPEKSAKE